MRKPAVAGQFYEAGFNDLDKQLRECFLSKRGPGETPSKRMNREIKAVIAPHAGYMFSGACAAWAYKEIGESGFADVYIIIGPSHYGIEKAAITTEPFSMPFGIVRVDSGFAGALLKKKAVVINDDAHANEHCIEVQLPFLQFVSKDCLDRLKIVPILVSHDTDYKKLGLDLKEAIMESGKKAVVIASSDFTHYGRNYHYIPFSSDIQKRMYGLDEKAIEFVKNLNPDGLVNYCYDTGATICGSAAIAAMLSSVKAKKAELLQYYTSADLAGDYRNAVGYASMVIK